ncbi:MAG: hypothetical protein H0Z19_01305 [Archaeoglobus sp.]|uniref:DUF6834 family protein n=1 Tax=Archaeoglobus sp. TaxID=1872626 RepID=UPI001E1A1F0C|nr:hypothetical protein [Archaeoglobus sp.]MBO8179111.1 hypothetical protein [Archaeoglobus sp.]
MDVQVVEELSKMLVGRKVVTEEEVRRKAIRCALKVLGPKLAEADDVFIEDVTCSLIDCPISLKSLHFSEKVKIGDIFFYYLHTEKPEKEDFELAYEEYLKSTRYLEGLEAMIETTDRFFEGYSANGLYLRKYSKDKSYSVFYSTIDDVFDDVKHHLNMLSKVDGEYVVVVPTEKELNPFLKFFKRYSEDAKRAGLKIWVVNPEEKTIDPFIGYPKDFKLLKGFKNPKAAALVSTYWRVDVKELD